LLIRHHFPRFLPDEQIFIRFDIQTEALLALDPLATLGIDPVVEKALGLLVGFDRQLAIV
jgi:hypothetical protein